jgi:hypothetical protein
MTTKRIYNNEDGSISVWEYDLAKNPTRPISVTEYPAGHKLIAEVQRENEKNLLAEKKVLDRKKPSKTKMKYLNPATGKEVGYVRAKNLGLI